MINEYLAATKSHLPDEIAQKVEALANRLNARGVSFVSKEDVERIETVEKEEAGKRKIHEYKFVGDGEMLAIITQGS